MFVEVKNYRHLSIVSRQVFANLMLCLCLTLPILAAPGDLDLTFDTDGKVTTPFGVSSYDAGYSVAIQTDGKILVGGSSGSNFALARYNPDGSLDATFGTGGLVTTSIGGIADVISDIAIQPDGKIVAVGSSYNGSNHDVAVARYNADGSLDMTFDTDGKLTTPIGASNDGANAVVISGINIVVAGFSQTGSQKDFALLRYKPDGSLDGGFGTGGIVTTPIRSLNDDEARDVAIQTDGKIIAVGFAENSGTLDWDFALARYNTDGTLDTSFDMDGMLTSPIGTGDDYADTVAIQPDGFIVAAGYSSIGGSLDFALIRYKPDGALDAAFGTGGKVTTPIGSLQDIGRAVAIQSDGKILLAGFSNNGANHDFALVRYNANGSLDTVFGIGGKVTTPFGTEYDDAFDIAIQTDGKIVLAGLSETGANGDFAVARYLGAPNSNLYVINDSAAGNQIYGFSVNETTGALSLLTGFPVATGGTGCGCFPTEQITVDRVNNRLYVINDGSETVSAYSINPVTGALIALPFSPISLGAGNWATIAVHPTGSPLIVGDGDPTPQIRSFTITPGAATEAIGSPYSPGLNAYPFSSVFSLDGNFFYTGGNGGAVFAGFSVAAATGILTPLAGSPFNSGNNNPVGYATDTQGRLFLISGNTGGELNVFTTTTGIPTAASGNPFASGLTQAADGVLHPYQQFYFVANRSVPNSVGSYQISGTGAATTLTAVAGSPFASGGFSTGALVTNQTGTFLFTANGFSRNLTTYAVNSTNGVLTNIVVQPSNTLGMTGILTGIAYYTPPLAATSATVSVGGRVTTASGRGIPRAQVTLSGGNGETFYAITNPFGYYRFDGVEVGGTYVLQITHKRYQFSPQVIAVTDNTDDVNFIADDFGEQLLKSESKSRE